LETQRPHDFSHPWKTNPKINIYTKTNSDVEHACKSGTILWNSGKEGKEKSMIISDTT
jgi:hypothetical protein